MAKPSLQTKLSTFSRHKTLSVAAAVAILITFSALWSFTDPQPCPSSLFHIASTTARTETGRQPKRTFYDDPEVGYTLDKPMINWDEKRRDWLNQNPSFASRNRNEVLMVTGSQPWPCTNPEGDHLLLRFFKNKVDYCRIHGFQIFYNNAFMHTEMRFGWAKVPVLRAAMVAHPEAEWLFWVDSDAAFTDMEFRIPFERYEDCNLVAYGWPKALYEEKSWVGLNDGVFLLRNCQWSMDFLDVWAGMGPKSSDHAQWGKILQSTLTEMKAPRATDQAAMVYMLVEGEKRWREMTRVETQYELSAYWVEVVDRYEQIASKHAEMEKGVQRRRHAEAVTEDYEAPAPPDDGRLRPFVTHFTGCVPCAGAPNPAFEGDSCRVGIERALNFADNQVLRSYGFVRPEINGSDLISA